MNDDQPLLNADHDYSFYDDEKKSMAILNLQAILNLDDVDVVIALLQQNNWDEASAASAYYAQQIHQEDRQRSRDQNQFQQEEQENNVRAPMQFQQEQLIDDNVNLIANVGFYEALARQRQRSRTVPNYIFTNNVEDLPVQAEEQRQQQEPGVQQQEVQEGGVMSYVWSGLGFIKYTVKAVWRGVAWFFSFFMPRGDVAIETNGEEFKTYFSERIEDLNIQQQLKVRIFDRSFHELCEESRAEKRPILIMVLADDEDQTIQYTMTSINNDAVVDTINNSYILYGMFRNQLVGALQENLHFPQNSTLSLWALFVRHDHNIQINSRLAGSEDEFRPDRFATFLNENLDLFHIMAEEDPEYQRLQILQDAGMIPLLGNNRQSNNHNSQSINRHDMFDIPMTDESSGGDNNSRIVQDRLLRERQRQELQEAQAQDRKRKQLEEEKVNKQKQEELKARELEKENERILQEKIKQAQQKKEQLPEEPSDKDPNSCHLVFRMPGSGERVNRRFLKDEKVEMLYDFVDSLGDKIQFENVHASYTILQSMPRKEFTDKDKTLVEEGLFPRAMLQIKENE